MGFNSGFKGLMLNYLYIGGCRILLAIIIFVNRYSDFKVSLGLLQLIVTFIHRTYIFNVKGEVYLMVFSFCRQSCSCTMA